MREASGGSAWHSSTTRLNGGAWLSGRTVGPSSQTPAVRAPLIRRARATPPFMALKEARGEEQDDPIELLIWRPAVRREGASRPWRRRPSAGFSPSSWPDGSRPGTRTAPNWSGSPGNWLCEHHGFDGKKNHPEKHIITGLILTHHVV